MEKRNTPIMDAIEQIKTFRSLSGVHARKAYDRSIRVLENRLPVERQELISSRGTTIVQEWGQPPVQLTGEQWFNQTFNTYEK